MKAGDVVMLKSGGPRMTVRWIEGDEAFCEWFDKDLAVKSEKFPLTSMKSAEG